MLAGVFIWVCVLKSGIHATLAGVIVGLAMPLRVSRPMRMPEITGWRWGQEAASVGVRSTEADNV